MYTKAMINEMFQNDVAATREWRKQYKADYEQIEKTFNETRDLGPKQTVKTLIDRIGYDRAQAVVATMINTIGKWDGRIDDRNRAWAETIDEAFDKEAATDASIYCSLHSCHADQIAAEMRRAERPAETVETVNEESIEDVTEDAAEAVTEAEKATESEPVEDDEKRIEMLAWSIQDAIERENTGAMTDEEIAQIESAEEEPADGPMIDRDAISEYIDSLCDPDSLGVHDYIEEMKRDIAQYIADEAEIEDGEDRDDFEQRINDNLWIEDSVTGNGSGSYTCSRSKAHENVMGNEHFIRNLIDDFGVDAKELVDRFMSADYEWFDVLIRCYLLGQVLSEVIDELTETGAIRFVA